MMGRGCQVTQRELPSQLENRLDTQVPRQTAYWVPRLEGRATNYPVWLHGVNPNEMPSIWGQVEQDE
jgi:hypothetical protein